MTNCTKTKISSVEVRRMGSGEGDKRSSVGNSDRAVYGETGEER